MNKKIVIITSSFPFGKSEVWAINEINSLLDLGSEITIIPRTGQGKITNQDAVKFTSNLIDLPFLNWTIFIFLLRNILFRPFLFLKLLIEIIKQSNTIIDFVKGLIILPKSLFLAKILKSRNVDHIHSFSTTSTAVMAHIISSNLNELNEKISIYPNPSNGKLFISTSELIKSIKVTNIIGKEIYSNNNFNNNSIDLINLNNGVYFIKLSTEKGTITKKIILTK